MFKNYLKITLRNLRLHPGYTAINLAGLAVGMACCLLIGLYLQDELSFDRFHEKKDRIHRVVIDYTTNGITSEQGYTQGLLAPLLVAEIPEVEAAVRLLSTSGLVVNGERRFNEESLLYADANFFSVFSFDFLSGNQALALQQPNSIVLTEALAEKYFGSDDPIGAALTVNNDRQLTVTGIVKSPPAQSHIRFDALISMSTLDTPQAPTWMFREWLSTFVQTYVLLNDAANPQAVEAKIAALVEEEAGEMMRGANRWVALYLEPMTAVYLTSQRDGLGPRGDQWSLKLFALIAGFIMIIACINFMNLATARAMNRAREVGVRKTLGAVRAQLVIQFLSEAILLAFIAMIGAYMIAKITLAPFNMLAGKSITLVSLFAPVTLGWLLACILLVGLLAGSYPALVLSGFRPIAVLKGKVGRRRGSEQMRKGLVVFQFAISVALIVATAIVFRQVQFMKKEQLGFQKEQVLVLNFQGDTRVRQQLSVIKEELGRVPGVQAVAASQTVPGWGLPQAGGAVRLPEGNAQDLSVGLYMVDIDFFDLYQMEMVAGRAFSTDLASDSSVAYILNQTAVKQLGLPAAAAALDREANFWGNAGRVIGVARDIHHYGLQNRVTPMALRIDEQNLSLFSLRIHPQNMASTIAGLQAKWAELVPHRPFEYQFLDEMFDAQYHAEERFGRVFATFTGLAMLIACLGLFGLAAFMVQRRTKEIGVRKVMGASSGSVLLLINKDFSLLVLFATLLASPIIYFTMENWLEAFPYRQGIPLWLFVGAGAVVLVIAWLTVSIQSLRAAYTNPVDALRHE